MNHHHRQKPSIRVLCVHSSNLVELIKYFLSKYFVVLNLRHQTNQPIIIHNTIVHQNKWDWKTIHRSEGQSKSTHRFGTFHTNELPDEIIEVWDSLGESEFRIVPSFLILGIFEDVVDHFE